jgi:hypothetical protein
VTPLRLFKFAFVDISIDIYAYQAITRNYSRCFIMRGKKLAAGFPMQ